MRLSHLLAAVTALLSGVDAAGFHILTAHCVERSFSKRSTHALEDAQNQTTTTTALTPRQKSNPGPPLSWHETDRYTTVRLMPSSDYNCNRLSWDWNLAISTLNGVDFFQAGSFCNHALNFYRIGGDRWEVWENNANPGIKWGECYAATDYMTCESGNAFIKHKCEWTRSTNRAMNPEMNRPPPPSTNGSNTPYSTKIAKTPDSTKTTNSA
ncbi:hypothetical protein B0T16DRAFT_490987 [Cercophora newfieldiana]|uniref:Uncharacterized protein n=1 Tax=Cercophora newfieldiana TaxID=92897 RepID=A0AA40CRM2_9PEZI|nr:hypothetical protein B0T16DRAFT_490987 [Cercophora newfieldiana]